MYTYRDRSINQVLNINELCIWKLYMTEYKQDLCVWKLYMTKVFDGHS